MSTLRSIRVFPSIGPDPGLLIIEISKGAGIAEITIKMPRGMRSLEFANELRSAAKEIERLARG